MVGISIRDAKSLCFLYILILLSSMESSTLIAKASSNNNNDKQLRCISTLADQQSNSVGGESSHICDNDNICIRYDFLGSSIAGCFPKVKDGLDTCQFVKSFGSNVCCCDTDNCNNANCFKEDKAVIIQPLRELQTTSTSVCTSSPPGKGYVEPCQFPFTYVDTTTGKRITYTSCASTNEAPPFQVIKKGVSNAMWCPSAIALNEKGEYSMQDEARRDKWGVCNCMTNTNHQCTVGEYKSRFGPLKSGKCSFPFKVLDKDNKSVWIHTCVPMNVIRPFASEAFNVANLDGASWCPTDTGVSSDGVYDKQNPDTNQNWGLCSQCVETTDPGTPRVTAAPVSLPPTPPTASPQFDLQNAVAGYEYEYGGTPSPTKRPTTKAPGSTPAPTTLSPTNRPTTASPTNRPTTKAPGTTPTAPTTANPTTTSPTKRPTTKAPTKKPGTETDAPTIAPSLAPTLIPTLAPNSLPTSSPAITEMDVYVHADMSRSISMANPVCMKDTGSKCWDLEVDFARDLQARLAAQLGGYYDPNSGSSKGLRFWLSTFTCIKGKAITNVLTQLTGSQTEIDAALAQMAALKPYLGTCPTQGLGYVLDSIKAHFNDPGRTNRAVIIVTDGRFDDPDSRTASPVTKQMINWGAEVFAVAVGKEIDRKQLQGVTHDASGSRIVSIDSFSSLAASGDRVAKYAVKLFRKPTVGQPTVLAQRPPSVYPTKPDGTSSEGQGNDGDSDADYINGGKSQGAAGKTNSVVIGSVIGFVAVGAAVGFFVRRRRLSRSNSSGNRHNNNGGNQVGTNIQITSHLESKPVVSASAQHVQKPSPAPSTSKALSTGVRPGTRPVAQESPVASPVSFKGLSNTPPVGQSLPGRKALASTTATKKSATKSTSASQAKGSSSVYQSKLADPRTWASSSAATKPTNQKPSSSTPSI